MDYSKLINNLTAEMKKGTQYARIPLVARIFLIVAMIPLIISFVVTKIFYWITLFGYKMIASPAEYLHEWLKKQKDEVQHATQAVMYWVCLPFIFGLQLLLSFSSLVFFIQWFLLMIQGYLLTLGGIKWQPFITEAVFEEDNTEYECKPSEKAASIFAYVAGGVVAVIILLTLIAKIFEPAIYDAGPGLYKFYRGLGSVKNFFSYVHIILIAIVNPILFKRVPKN